MTLLHKMRGMGTIANVISFSAAISVSEKGGQWKYTVTLVHTKLDTSMTAHVMSLVQPSRRR